jgi:hypothetical protein
MAAVDESNKVVWAYMVDEGKLTNGTWSYYGGDWESPHGYDWRKIDKANIDFKEKVKSVGVDWAKTQPPQSSMESAFTDTFHDSDDVETLLGTIVLKDGSEYTVGVSNADKKFGEYVKIIMEYVKDQERVKNVFGE